MSALGTVEEIADILTNIAADVSVFAPGPAKAVAIAVQGASATLSSVLKAIDNGLPPDSIVAAVESAMKAAVDLQMREELK